ncbi:hypothetical protein HBZS_112400 [Helicobacter bizzozeronii CCUG 35545]|nr:hypothetical protein HBZS_112400 [Helicobacter bizzozeronii CCUG 35545]
MAKKSPKRFVGFDARSIREPIASLFYTHKVAIPYQEHILKRNQQVLQEGLSVIYPPQTWEQTLNERHLAFFLPPHYPRARGQTLRFICAGKLQACQNLPLRSFL